MQLKSNREFVLRHLFVTVLLAGMGLWFAYDGLVTYPSLSARELYLKIEHAEPHDRVDLDAFKRQKTQSQYGFSVLALAASLAVGLHLLACTRFRFAFDETGFDWNGRRYGYGDIRAVDRSRWEKKAILRLVLADGSRVTLDAWHHAGVRDFESGLGARINQTKGK